MLEDCNMRSLFNLVIDKKIFAVTTEFGNEMELLLEPKHKAIVLLTSEPIEP